MARGILQTGKQLSSGHAITDKVSMDFDTQQHWGENKIKIQSPQHLYNLKQNKTQHHHQQQQQ